MSSTTHSWSMPYTCPKCSKPYQAKSSLKAHTDKCILGVRYPCTDCGDVFLSKTNRNNHVKHVHRGIKRKSQNVPCPECGQVFQNNKKMEDHRDARHDTGREYPCLVCGDIFTTEPKLTFHKRKHDEPRFVCACGRKFASKQNLGNHYKSTNNTCTAPEVIQPNVVQKESITVRQKRKYETGNAAKKFFYTVSEQLKNFYTEATPLSMDGIPCCYHHDCDKESIGYGVEGGDFVSCKEHKESHHVNLSDLRLCVYKGCKTKGTITIEACSENFCSSHAKSLIDQGLPEEFVNFTKGAKCSVDGCEVGASFDKERYCKGHSPTKASDDTRICQHEGCVKKRPTFGFPGQAKTKCREHKEEGMFSRKVCDHDGCFIGASYGPSDGVSQRCKQHKKEGDVVESKCAMSCCMDGEGIQGKYLHPEHEDKQSVFFAKRICSFARRYLIEVAITSINKGDYAEVRGLLDHFGLQNVVTLTAQGAFLIGCEKEYHSLLKDCVQGGFDESVIGEAKSLGNKRPDIFYKWVVNGQGFAIHIEYDETSGHEDDTLRLERIAKEAACEGRTYVIRVRGRHDTTNPVCEDVYKRYYKYSALTQSGMVVCAEVAKLVKERIGWINEGLAPEDSTRIGKVFV